MWLNGIVCRRISGHIGLNMLPWAFDPHFFGIKRRVDWSPDRSRTISTVFHRRCGCGVVLRGKTDIPSCAPLQSRRGLCTAASAADLHVSLLELRDTAVRSSCLSIRRSILLLNLRTKGISYDHTEIRHCSDLPYRSFCSRLGSIENRDSGRTQYDLPGMSNHG